ncbi:MAG TPA: hypothetical protein VNS09_18140 [Solirubrobacter sp.]|nr:hypothetical protein [Solirubrobacter sp.]
MRIERGWITVDGARGDDGRIHRGGAGELRLSPFDAVRERHDAEIPMSAILKASVQRLAFWRR